jgi:hypothetical protein
MGVKQRLSDSSSVYVEERYHDAGSQNGLTHAAGVNLVEKERWNFGASAEVGTLVDSQTSAQTDRKAAGVLLGYNRDSLQLTSAVEYRRDDAEQADTTQVERSAWLFRNSIKYQLTPDWRVVGKLNHSFSDSSLGDFFGGGYTEAVVGYGYRPVRNDRERPRQIHLFLQPPDPMEASPRPRVRWERRTPDRVRRKGHRGDRSDLRPQPGHRRQVCPPPGTVSLIVC